MIGTGTGGSGDAVGRRAGHAQIVRCWGDAMSVNPYPPIVLHNAIVVAASIGVSRYFRKTYVAVPFGFAVGLAASLLWRHINFSFYVGWRDLFFEPIFAGHLWRYWPNAEKILGFLFNWVLPSVLGCAGVYMYQKWGRRTGAETKNPST